MAGATGLEPATDGFGDRYATNCATRLGAVIVVRDARADTGTSGNIC